MGLASIITGDHNYIPAKYLQEMQMIAVSNSGH